MSDKIDRYDIERLRSIADWFASFPNDDYKDDALFIEDVISKIAAAESMGEPLYATGTAVDSDQYPAHFVAYLEGLLKAEREKVRVLREALEKIYLDRFKFPTWKIASDALATTKEQGE